MSIDSPRPNGTRARDRRAEHERRRETREEQDAKQRRLVAHDAQHALRANGRPRRRTPRAIAPGVEEAHSSMPMSVTTPVMCVVRTTEPEIRVIVAFWMPWPSPRDPRASTTAGRDRRAPFRCAAGRSRPEQEDRLDEDRRDVLRRPSRAADALDQLRGDHRAEEERADGERGISGERALAFDVAQERDRQVARDVRRHRAARQERGDVDVPADPAEGDRETGLQAEGVGAAESMVDGDGGRGGASEYSRGAAIPSRNGRGSPRRRRPHWRGRRGPGLPQCGSRGHSSGFPGCPRRPARTPLAGAGDAATIAAMATSTPATRTG